MPELAKQIVVKRQGNECEIVLHVDRDDFPGVTLTLLADEVLVEDRQKAPPPPKIDWLLRNAKTGEEVARYPTRQQRLVGDIVTAPDGTLWCIKEKDAVNHVFDVVFYTG